MLIFFTKEFFIQTQINIHCNEILENILIHLGQAFIILPMSSSEIMDNYSISEESESGSEESRSGKNCTIGRTRMIDFEKDQRILVIIQKYEN